MSVLASTVDWFKYERELYLKGFQYLGGIDEAGRGPLAGPVVAACVYMPENLFIEGVNDSKKLSEKVRSNLYHKITTHPDIRFGVGVVSHEIIDKINILEATKRAMEIALDDIQQKLEYLLVDGLKLHHKIPSKMIVKGDANSHLIAAASILAKVTRDRLMLEYHEKWPVYNFVKHKGYGTKKHLEAILKYGPCPIHRKSFEPIKSMLTETWAF